MENVDILRAACCIAGLDGQISENEEPVLRRLKEVAGVGEASFKAMCDMAIDEREHYYERQLEFLSSDAEPVVRVLLEVANADGDFSENERVILQHLAGKIGIDAERFAEIASGV